MESPTMDEYPNTSQQGKWFFVLFRFINELAADVTNLLVVIFYFLFHQENDNYIYN